MGILEIGVNIGNHNLISVKYYAQEDVPKSKLLKSFSDLRYDFIAAIDDIAKNLFGKELSVVSLSEYRLIYISESVKDPYDTENDIPETAPGEMFTLENTSWITVMSWYARPNRKGAASTVAKEIKIT